MRQPLGARAGEQAGAVGDALQDGVQVKVLRDPAAGLPELGEALAQRLVLTLQLVDVGSRHVGPLTLGDNVVTRSHRNWIDLITL